MTGLYIPKDTAIHRAKPGFKLIFLVVSGTIIFLIKSLPILISFLFSTLLLYFFAKIPFKVAVKQIRPIIPLLIIIFLFQFIFDNWLNGITTVLRFVILILLASLLSLTTKASDMVDAIETGLTPLTFMGVNPSKCSMAISMAIRFIPVITQKYSEVREAQSARGLDRSIKALAVPLIVRTIKMANEVAEALDARSYDSEPVLHNKRQFKTEEEPGHQEMKK